jgi:hypothetical protein
MWIFIWIACNSSGSATVKSSLEDSGVSEDTAVADSGLEEEDTSISEPSEPDSTPVDADGDGVFEDDCDDDDPTVYPMAEEICDNKDNNCDGQIDEDDICPCPYRSLENKAYYFCTDNRRWRDAKDDCTDLGAVLISIESEEENTYIAEQANSIVEGKWWIGLNDRDTEDSFEWDEGVDVVYEAWNDGEPNNYNNEDCIEMYSSTGVWNDARCRNEQGFVCSFPIE